MSLRMRSKERISEKDANKWAWKWSIGLVLIIGLAPVAGAILGELIAMAMGCEVAMPSLNGCTRSIAFLESFALSLMSMIRWAIITVPAMLVMLLILLVTFTIQKKRSEQGR